MKLSFKTFIAMMTAVLMVGCHHIDDDRIPAMPVYIPFASVGVWDLYGVSGAGQYRYFIKSESKPANYPYTATAATGFGGVLLISDIHSQPVAYDLACPVECRANTRIQVLSDEMIAECPVCHSTYDVITNYGYPLSGPAAERGYGLQRYYVSPASGTTYMVITR